MDVSVVPAPDCASTTPCELQRAQPFVDLFVTLGTETVKVPQNSKLAPSLSDERSGMTIDVSNESARGPRHTTSCVLEIPLPSNEIVPTLPSRRAQLPDTSMPPASAKSFLNPKALSVAAGIAM